MPNIELQVWDQDLRQMHYTEVITIATILLFIISQTKAESTRDFQLLLRYLAIERKLCTWDQ